ncbi:translation initiation factor eIF3 subunit domain-containing protein [Ceratobasidium sp. AG-Ba]|nr:translation initiation factor eIF3 subunit domain-containing protein [Ceratobasidium sp. AG-Ba]QRW04273.1 translation initiation factor eIF3 subunit domain-containing protein [Ceratobasidium sp. AG-Ba]
MGGDNWDDSESDTPAAPPPRAAAPVVPRPKPSKWADEDAEEKPASDWDASTDEERKTFKAKMAEKEAAAAAGARRGAAGELDPDEWRAGESDDEKSLTVAEQRARELESDLKNASDLLGAATLGDAPTELAELLSFEPRSKEDFQKLSNMIMEHVIQRHQSKPLYATFIELHARALSEPLRDVDIRKVASGLSTLANEKQKEARDKASGKKKPKAAQKPGLGLTKPGAKKVDTAAYEEALDDFGDDDFM